MLHLLVLHCCKFGHVLATYEKGGCFAGGLIRGVQSRLRDATMLLHSEFNTPTAALVAAIRNFGRIILMYAL